jgi:hypothetical protein
MSYAGLVLFRILTCMLLLALTHCVSEGDVLERQDQTADTGSGGSGDSETAVLFVDFESSPVGPYPEATIEADFGELPWADDQFTEIVEDARGRVLRVHYPAGGVGPSEGGAVWQAPLGAVYEEVTASFKLRFGPGFDFVQGGMLPGLAGGEANANQDVPDGTDGWTARASWDIGGTMKHFVYHPDQAGSYGDELAWPDVTLLSDRWYEITQRVVMNTPGVADGFMQISLDGTVVLDWQGVRWRDVPTLGIDILIFSTFFGGAGDAFRSAKDEYTDFDDFRVVAQE